jgi:uncharacterized protein
VTSPRFDDTERTFDELRERLTKTVTYLENINESGLHNAATSTVAMSLRGKDLTFTGVDYLFQFALPNFYFHVTTAYDILRQRRVQVGKLDYLGPLGTT